MTPENLERLGAARLAEILVEVAGTRAELKRRLRMELAAEQGAEHLLPEIDRRLASLGASRGAVTWRQRPALVRDLAGLRDLIATRLAPLDPAAALDRLLQFLLLAPRVEARVRDKEGAVAAVFRDAAADLGTRLCGLPPDEAGARLAAAIETAPARWAAWISPALAAADPELARAALRYLPARRGPGFAPVLRALADAANDPDAFRESFPKDSLTTPSVAADVAARYLAAGRLDEARALLEAAVKPGLFRLRAAKPAPDFAWETVWIDYLEASGQHEAAQAARWAAFERDLSVQRAKAFVARLPDFEDVEAEHRIFELAANQQDATQGLALLIDWPALPEAARLIEARRDDLTPTPDQAEAWAAKLRVRFPAAAETVLRRAAALSFRRREFKVSDRLTKDADAISG